MDWDNVRKKLLGYALNTEHPAGKNKARVFARIGFSIANWQVLADQLVFEIGSAAETEKTAYGTKYEQVIEVELPDRIGTREVLTVWINPHGSNQILLVTTYVAD